MVILIIAGIFIFFSGFTTAYVWTCKKAGLFIIDDTDNDKTHWILDVKIDPTTVPSRKRLIFRVKKIDERSC